MMSEYRRELAFKAGRKAALEGKPETANNRERGTIFFDDWADGWGEGELARAMSRGRDIPTVRSGGGMTTPIQENRSMTDKTHVEHLELCLRTVEDNVNFALSAMRAAHFNRDSTSEHHREVVLARMREVSAYAMNWAMSADAKAKEPA